MTRSAAPVARRDPNAGVAERFDAAAAGYVGGRSSHPAFEGEQTAILGLLGNEPRLLLEVGAGVGLTAHALARKGWSVVASDLSLEMLRGSRQLEAREESRLQGHVRCDLTHLPFRTGGLPSVVCHGVLEYVPDPDRALAEVARVLAPKGSAVVTIPNSYAPGVVCSHLLRALGRWRGGRASRSTPFSSRTPRAFDRAARAVGLSPRGGRLETFTPFPVYRTPRGLLRALNRIMARAPRALRGWGVQYVVALDRAPRNAP